ncbi:MAG: RNA-binding domain-containing protein [Pseudomonadota bacterium]
MDEGELRQRVAAGEDSRFEAKSVASTPNGLPDSKDLAKALCAFANAGGGHVAIGVEDDGSIAGIGDRAAADRLQRHVSQVALGIDPPLRVHQELYDLDGKRVLVVGVSPFQVGRPFSANRHFFVRDGNLSRDATRDELERLFASRGQVTHDEQVIEDAPLDSLDQTEVRALLERAIPRFREPDALKHLRNAHCVQGDHPTVAGILLFSSDPSAYVPGATITALRFEGDVPRTATLANDTITGPLRLQIERAVEFVRAHVPRPSARTGVARAPTGGVPDSIWIEAITNAVSHRDYHSRTATRIFVFDSRVEIINPGDLLNRLTVDAIKLGMPQYRNPAIARLLARAQQRDNAGLGVPEIFAAAAEAELPEPEIAVSGGEFRLTVHTRRSNE